MSKPKTRMAALLLGCILLLTGMLLACENVPNIPDVSGSSAAESSSDDSSEPERKLSAEEWLETLPERDYTGTVFTIAATETGYVVPADEEEPGLVDVAAVKRNELSAAKYGVDIQEKALKTGTLATELKTARAAGVSYADAVLAPARDLAAAAAAGELMNMYSLPYFDLSADYMTKPLATDGVIHNTCYAVYGSATGAENSAWVVYYNRTLLSGAGYDEMERLAASGDWTIGRLRELAEAVAAETMEKRSPDSSRDIFGYSSYYNDDDFLLSLWQTSGVRAFGDSAGQPLELRYDFEKAQSALDELGAFLASKAMFPASGQSALKAFGEGRLAFFIYRLDFAAVLAEQNVDWGLLPLPALFAGETSVSPLDELTVGLAVPSVQTDSERTGLLLNAFFAASHEHMRQALMNNYVHFYLSDNDQALMLEQILDRVRADAALLYAPGYANISAVSADLLTELLRSGGDLERRIEPLRSTFENFAKTNFR